MPQAAQTGGSRRVRRLHRRSRRRPACFPWNPRYRDLGRHRLRLDTNRGPIEARAAIVTVSTAVLASGVIRFDPPADEHLHAASRLPLGLADKIFLSLARAGRSPAGEPPARPLRRRPNRQLLPAALRPTRRRMLPRRRPRPRTRGWGQRRRDRLRHRRASQSARRRFRPQPCTARGDRLGPRADDPRLLQPRRPRIGGCPRYSGPAGEPSPLLRRRGLLATRLLDRPRCLAEWARGGGPDRGCPLSRAASWRNLYRRQFRQSLSVRPMP